MFKKIVRKIFPLKLPVISDNSEQLIDKYISNGRIPWSKGYSEYKWAFILKSLEDKKMLTSFGAGEQLEEDFAIGLDERTVEYPWIFSKLSDKKSRILDAGSTFNFSQIVNLDILKQKDLSILTYFPEENIFNNKRISYIYSDLREVPFRDEWFDEIVCQSTIEHIEMDNSIYGYDTGKVREEKKNYEYLKAVNELVRVLKKKGVFLLTFPYGEFENHGFFQQFDREMLNRLEQLLKKYGECDLSFFMYRQKGWSIVTQEECDHSISYNPHTGRGKGVDGAAHCRGICCIKFVKL